MTAHICAWCKSGLGDTLAEQTENEVKAMIGEEVDHGICEECERGLMVVDQDFAPCLTKKHVETLMGRV